MGRVTEKLKMEETVTKHFFISFSLGEILKKYTHVTVTFFLRNDVGNILVS